MLQALDLTTSQQQMIQCALDAAADALSAGEWPELTGWPTGDDASVAPLMVHLAGLIGSAKRVTLYMGYGEDA